MTGTEADRSALLVGMGVRRWRFERGAAVSIGRATGCDIVVDDPLLSREHVRIEYRGNWVLEDAGSRNGTWVDGRKLRSHELAAPVVLRLGDRRSGPTVTVERVVAGRSGGVPDAGTISIGRARDNDIILNDVLVSRHHARVETVSGSRRVVDLDSRNRTLVNGTPVAPTLPLTDGDRLTVGNTEFSVDENGLRPTTVAMRRLVVDEVRYELPKVGSIVTGVGFGAGPGELVAVIGPSGAGKSTLLKLLTGQLRPSSGVVSYDGYDVYGQFDAVRALIGVVPQEDVVHRKLTVRQALTFAAKLRLTDDVSAVERRETIEAVLAELGLTEHARTRVDRLSGGQRKRVSIALELLTSPSLLLLDEPTSGLDPALDKHIMATLRSLADKGRTVVVVTHNLSQLEGCDRVLLLAPGGLPVYFGRPAGLFTQFGTADWADVFGRVIEDPVRACAGFVAPEKGQARRVGPDGRGRASAVVPASWGTRLRQARTLAARHGVLIAADRAYAVFLLLLPLLLAGLVLVVPGRSGLLTAGPDAPGEAGQILVLLFVGAAFAGGAVAAREVIGERAVLIRERAAGLQPSAYALAKLAVFGAVCVAQAVVLAIGCAVVRPVPPVGVLFGSGTVELAIALWCTALACCQLSLLFSAMVRSAEQVMPALVVTVMAQLVLCGGLVPVTGRPVVSQLSWVVPARWGYAAGAATVDLRAISPGSPADALWRHAAGPWLLSISALTFGMVLTTALVARRVSRIERS